MGRPYAEELDRLEATYAWALTAPLGSLSLAVSAAASLPLVAVGSGGSYTTAHFAAAVHRQYVARAASAMTPLEAVSTPQSLRQAAVLLATAGGRNSDVLGAFGRLAAMEPRQFIVLCARAGSPLASLARKHDAVCFAEFEPPSGKDGFLATNTLFASATVLARAYAAAFAARPALPARFAGLLPGAAGALADLDQRCEQLWKRQTLVVLYGPGCSAAAVDLESKFSEAALATVQLADYRNFAHGRHHWLAKRGGETGILAIVSDEDRALAGAVLDLIPDAVPVVRLDAVGHGPALNLSALVQVFVVAASAGRARGIDPGNPKVPAFGRKIYHLRAIGRRLEMSDSVPAAEAVAIERKSGVALAALRARGTLEDWRAAYLGFCTRLSEARFRGVVLDYDGTLCSESHRFEPLPTSVARQLNRLLRAEVVLGVATGRGKSAKDALRRAIGTRYWERVIVGYYNGGDVALLADDAQPNGTDSVCPPLTAIAARLRENLEWPGLARLTFRLPQITIEAASGRSDEDVWALVQHIIYTTDEPGVAAVRSSHSMDVLAPGVTKLAVVDRIRGLIAGGPDVPILCIGDRGLWPGNDYSLLATPHALSADEVSPDPRTGWNLARPGRRGASAAFDYLEALGDTQDGLQLRL